MNWDAIGTFVIGALTTFATGAAAFAVASTPPNIWAILAMIAGSIASGALRVQSLNATPQEPKP